MQYRQKLAGLMRNASQAVMANEAMASDLETMATALDSMTDEKFASFINAEAIQKMFDGAKPVLEGHTPAPVENPNVEVTSEKSQWDKSAFAWNGKAAAMVKEKLAAAFAPKKANLDASRPDAVKAAELPKEQIPDGSHNLGTVKKDIAEATPAALTKEQTPNQAPVIDSEMVTKSEGTVKEANLYSFGGVDMPNTDAIDGAKVEPAEAQELGSLFGGNK
jgi:hypothetical protein